MLFVVPSEGVKKLPAGFRKTPSPYEGGGWEGVVFSRFRVRNSPLTSPFITGENPICSESANILDRGVNGVHV